MAANQDTPQKIHLYNSDDRQLLVDLLHEYSEKLVESSRMVARSSHFSNEHNFSLLKSTISILFGYILSASFAYLLWQFLASFIKIKLYEAMNQYGEFWYKYSGQNIYVVLDQRLLYDSSKIITITSFLLLPISLWLLKKSNLSPSSYLSHFDKSQLIEAELIERDARMIATRLESAMRLTVEVADQVETNLARKLELDLRIDDASYALEYYYSVVDSKVKESSNKKKPSSVILVSILPMVKVVNLISITIKGFAFNFFTILKYLFQK
jgi:hypothetical protein